MKRQVLLAEYKAKKIEDGGLEIVGEDGTVFGISPAALWPDEILGLIQEGDHIAAAKLLLGGEDRYVAFVAAGGSAIILAEIVSDELGASVGE